MYVNAGLVLESATEAQLASAMSHELAHVAARHGTRQASRGRIVDLASLPLIFMGGWIGYAVRQGAGRAVPLTVSKVLEGIRGGSGPAWFAVLVQGRLRPRRI